MFGAGGMNTRQVSRTLEVDYIAFSYAIDLINMVQYAFDDFAISQVAKLLQKGDDSVKVTYRRCSQ